MFIAFSSQSLRLCLKQSDEGDGVAANSTSTSFSVPALHLLTSPAVENGDVGPPGESEASSTTTTTGNRVKIPPLEKWTSNITEHIPYENLPGATGNYDLVRKVFERARRAAGESKE
jgi:hypothetical protein